MTTEKIQNNLKKLKEEIVGKLFIHKNQVVIISNVEIHPNPYEVFPSTMKMVIMNISLINASNNNKSCTKLYVQGSNLEEWFSEHFVPAE